MWWLWLLLGAAVVCGLLGAYVADERDRSGLEGAVLGFLLGPIGILVEVLLPAGQPPVERSYIAGRVDRVTAARRP